jgi:hypothetical protein
VYLDTYFVEPSSGVLMHGRYAAKAASHAGAPVSLDHSLPVTHVSCEGTVGSTLRLTLAKERLLDLNLTQDTPSLVGSVHALLPSGATVMGNVAHGLHDCTETFYTTIHNVSIVPHPTDDALMVVYVVGERTEWMDLYETADISLRNFHNLTAASTHAAKRGFIFPLGFPSDSPSSSSLRLAWNYDEATEGPLSPLPLLDAESLNVYLTCDECYFFLEVDFVFHTVLDFFWFPFPHVEPTLLLLELDQTLRMEVNASLEFQTAMTINLWEYSPDCYKVTLPLSTPFGCSTKAPGDPQCPLSPACLPNPGLPFGPLFILFTLKPQVDTELKAYFWARVHSLGFQARSSTRFEFRWAASDSPALPHVSFVSRDGEDAGIRLLQPGLSLRQRTSPKLRARLGFGPQLKMTWWGKLFPVSLRLTPLLGVETVGGTCKGGEDGVIVQPVWGVSRTIRIGILEDLRLFGKKVSFRVEGAIPYSWDNEVLPVRPIEALSLCLSLSPLAPSLDTGTSTTTEDSAPLADGTADLGPVEDTCVQADGWGDCEARRGCRWCGGVCGSVGEETGEACVGGGVDEVDANIEFVDPVPTHFVGPLPVEEGSLYPGQMKRLRWFLANRLVAAAGGSPDFHFALRPITRAEALGEQDGTSGPTLDFATTPVEDDNEVAAAPLVWACGFGLPCTDAARSITMLPGSDSFAPHATQYELYWDISPSLPPGTYQLVIFHTMEIAALSTFLYVSATGVSPALTVPLPLAALDGACSDVCGDTGVASLVPACAVATSSSGDGASSSSRDGGFHVVPAADVSEAGGCGQIGVSSWYKVPCRRVECVETPLVLIGPDPSDLTATGPSEPLLISWTGGRAGGHYHVEFLMPDCSAWVQIGYTAATQFRWYWPFREYFEAVGDLPLYRGELSTRFRVVLHESPSNSAISPHSLPMLQSTATDDGRTFHLDLFHQVSGDSSFQPVPVLSTPVSSTLLLHGRRSIVAPLEVELGPSLDFVDALGVLALGPGLTAQVRIPPPTRTSWTYAVIADSHGLRIPYRAAEREEFIVIQNPWMSVVNHAARVAVNPSLLSYIAATTDPLGFTSLVCRRHLRFSLGLTDAPLGGTKGVWFCSLPVVADGSNSLAFWDAANSDWIQPEECVADYRPGDLPFTNGHLTTEKTEAYREVAAAGEDESSVNLPLIVGLSVTLLIACACIVALVVILLIARSRRDARTRRAAAAAAVGGGGGGGPTLSSRRSHAVSRSTSRGTMKRERRNTLTHQRP